MNKYGKFEDFRPKIYYIDNKPMIDFFVEEENLFVVPEITYRSKFRIYKRYNYNELLNLVNYSRKYIPAQASLFTQVHKSIMTNDNEAVINILKKYSVCELSDYIKYLSADIDSKLVGFVASIFDPEKKERIENLLLFITELYQRALYVQGYESEYSEFVKIFL